MFTNKLIDLMLSKIITYDMKITSDDLVNKKIEAKQKWNQLYIFSMEYVLGLQFSDSFIKYVKEKSLY